MFEYQRLNSPCPECSKSLSQPFDWRKFQLINYPIECNWNVFESGLSRPLTWFCSNYTPSMYPLYAQFKKHFVPRRSSTLFTPPCKQSGCANGWSRREHVSMYKQTNKHIPSKCIYFHTLCSALDNGSSNRSWIQAADGGVFGYSSYGYVCSISFFG